MATRSSTGPAIAWPQVHAFRLDRHRLTKPSASTLPELCSAMGCFQAQVLSAAELQAGVRTAATTLEDVRRALWNDRTLVKTSLMRGTLHVVSRDDYPIYIAALKASRLRQMRQYRAKQGVSDKEQRRMTDEAIRALEDGPLSKAEITIAVASRTRLSKAAKVWMNQSWDSVVRQAVVEGQVCYAPDQGQESVFVRTEQWLKKVREFDEDEAKQNLLRRFVRAFGPVTRRDFIKWTGFNVAEAASAWTALEDEFAKVSIDGDSYFICENDYDAVAMTPPKKQSLRLLPHFDPYLLAHHSKEHLVAPEHYKRVYRNAGWISPTVLRNGRVAGVWSHKRRGACWNVDIEPFENFSRSIQNSLRKEAKRMGEFLGLSADVTFAD